MKEFGVVIPAFKRAVAFHDDLVRQIGGKTLLQRCIDKAFELVDPCQIFVLTDSTEIELICSRNKVQAIREDFAHAPERRVCTPALFRKLEESARNLRDLILLSPYEPLVSAQSVTDAYRVHCSLDYDLTVPVQRERRAALPFIPNCLEDTFVINAREKDVLSESRAFTILRTELISNADWYKNVKPGTYVLEEESVRIRNHRDWWVCEKLLECRRILFRVIGNPSVGMGHIYRALTLARDITAHEIGFVTDEQSEKCVQDLVDGRYWLETFPAERIAEGILALKPDLVVNDSLNTTDEYVSTLQQAGVKVVTFEDLGEGGRSADLTVNELYDEPVFKGGNVLWGHDFFFLRDEFTDATPCSFQENVERILVTFGGGDDNNLSAKVVSRIAKPMADLGVMIDVVTGPAYEHEESFRAMLVSQNFTNVEYTRATGVMSSIMERVQMAITSNGRTVYELAHMNIPSVVLSHNVRESSHFFASSENGFLNMGQFDPDDDLTRLLGCVQNLVGEPCQREELHTRMQPFDFTKSRATVIDAILKLVEEQP